MKYERKHCIGFIGKYISMNLLFQFHVCLYTCVCVHVCVKREVSFQLLDPHDFLKIN